MAILSRTAQHPHFAGFDGEVVVGTSNVDAAAANRFLIGGLGDGQAAVTREMFLEKAGEIRHHVGHDQDGSGETGGQACDEGLEWFERTRRTADYDDIPLGQPLPSFLRS